MIYEGIVPVVQYCRFLHNYTILLAYNAKISSAHNLLDLSIAMDNDLVLLSLQMLANKEDDQYD